MSEGLKSDDWHERRKAVDALGHSQDRVGAVKALEAVLRHDPDQHVRIDATVALGQLGGPDAIAVLIEMAGSTDESLVRTAALEAIETSRDPNAIPGLINLFRVNRGQDDVVAQIGASHALRKIGAPCVPQLLKTLNDPSVWVRRAVVEVLGEVGTPDIADRVAGLQADPSPVVRLAVEHALANLKRKPVPATPRSAE